MRKESGEHVCRATKVCTFVYVCASRQEYVGRLFCAYGALCALVDLIYEPRPCFAEGGGVAGTAELFCRPCRNASSKDFWRERVSKPDLQSCWHLQQKQFFSPWLLVSCLYTAGMVCGLRGYSYAATRSASFTATYLSSPTNPATIRFC